MDNLAGDLDDEEYLLSIGIGFIGAIIGTAGGIIVDLGSGATYTLSPEDLNVTLTKIGQKPQPNIILIDAEKFQEIKWIRIKCADIDEEDIFNLD